MYHLFLHTRHLLLLLSHTLTRLFPLPRRRLVKATPEEMSKYLSFERHLSAPAIRDAFEKVECDGDKLGSVRNIYLKGLEPGQFVTEM